MTGKLQTNQSTNYLIYQHIYVIAQNWYNNDILHIPTT